MPKSEIHTRKSKTNLAILAVIFGFCALIFAITLVKMGAL